MKKKQRILVLCESLDVNDSSATKGRVAFIESFKKIGCDVTVLHFTQREIFIENTHCIAVKEVKSSIYYLLSRVQRYLYRWFKIDISKYVDSIFGFSFGFFNDVNSIASQLRKQNPANFEMLWTFGKGSSFRPHAAVLKHKQWYTKWYSFVHDPYPQHLYPRPYNFVEYGFKKKRNFFRDITINAHKMVFPSLMLKEWMQSYFVDVNGKSLIIPHQITPAKSNKGSFPEYFDPENFNILHAGSLLDLRDPAPLVKAYELFLDECPEATQDSNLLFIGKPSIFSEYLLAKAGSRSQIYVSDAYVAFEEVYKMQFNASVNIILEASSEISPFLPGKFPHCVAANKPLLVIGPYYSESKRLLGKNSDFVFDFSDIQAIANTLLALYKTWKSNGKHIALNRPDILHYLSPAYLEETLLNETNKVC